jgi:signal transduction histidine kinase
LSFENILKNAVKYSENWWEIEIFIEQNSFSIKDYGIGIEEKNLDKIFDRYFRESYAKSWSGIGLSIIKRITEIYKWEIDIQSEKNKYTKVTISF